MTTSPFEPILRTAELRALEALHAGDGLMERAGAAAAENAMHMAQRAGPVVVLAGPGNNGGDALVAARLLRERFFDVVIVLLADPDKLPPDARAAYAAYRGAGGDVGSDPPPGRPALVIDGLFGIGLARPPAPEYAALIDWINRVDAPRLALDVPSGVDADTGRVIGTAVEASATATFLAWKPGLLTGAGLDYAGEVSRHTLGVDSQSFAPGSRLTWASLAALLPPPLRRGVRGAHKGTYGTLAIVGGARGMAGAALLAGRGAIAAGAGKVQVGLLDERAPAVDAGCPELMLRAGRDAFAGCDAIVVGPGLGRDTAARRVLDEALAAAVPLAIDADALNLIGADATLRAAVAARQSPTLLTPHPAEAARLLGATTSSVQDDRVAAALELARAFGAHVVLKGAGSVLADPTGGYSINASGNPGLAAGGTGDVLGGLLGGLLAQRIDASEALRIAVCVHGAAADALVARGIGPVGLRASELPDAVRSLLNARGSLPKE